MKKKLVVLLAVVMMFAFSASAYAATFSDVSDRPIVEQDAIKKAVALGIIEGYEDGTFGPDKTITRAEFAKIAVTAAGAKETATMLEANASAFKDVRANSWYTGWINAAESLGIFKGDTNGNFRPNDTISNQEAITVLLRLLGYNDNLTGTWPVNYVTKANQIGILDDVTIVASGAAKRGDIVVMLGATLDTPIVTYDRDTNEFVYKQTTKSGSSYITLLDDSFSGSFIEVSGTTTFNKIDQVRNVADKTLNWQVSGVQATLGTAVNENKVDDDKGNTYTLVVDENTAVSYNAAGLFDLEGHQGKVYYVTEGGRKYARFIEVKSYVQTVTDKVELNGTKATVGTANYNAATYAQITPNAKINFKNSNTKMFFNDDDLIYWVAADKDFTEKAYYVKAITTASARLVGTKTKTVNMADADTLIYADGKFVSPSDLEVGDAIMEIREGELYVKVTDASGDYTRTEISDKTGPADDQVYQHKATIGGKKFVFLESDYKAENDMLATDYVDNVIRTKSPLFYEEDLEASDVSSEDVYNNNVKYLLNKDNSIAAIIVDETSTGTTLYGVVVDGGANGTWGTNMSNVTLFTQEGYTVTYDFAKGANGKPATGMTVKDDEGKDKTLTTNKEVVEYFMGQPVSYKLDSDGHIKTFSRFADVLAGNELVKVRNNAYLVNENGNKRLSISLASNVVIFEVSDDKGEVDVSLVTRSSILSGGDFTPLNTKPVQMGYDSDNEINYKVIDAYAKYVTNSNNSVKAFAYTAADNTKYHYGVVKAWRFTDSDHAGYMSDGKHDFAITLVGDDNIYDLHVDSSAVNASGAGQFIVYTLSGNTLKIEQSYKKGASLYDNGNGKSKQVTGFNDGWIYFDPADPIKVDIDKYNTTGYTDSMNEKGVYRIMTDSKTVVYVLNSSTGEYTEGSLSDVTRNAYVYVPVIDDKGIAGAVLVDEYPINNRGQKPEEEKVYTGNITVKYTDAAGVTIGGTEAITGLKVDVKDEKNVVTVDIERTDLSKNDGIASVSITDGTTTTKLTSAPFTYTRTKNADLTITIAVKTK